MNPQWSWEPGIKDPWSVIPSNRNGQKTDMRNALSCGRQCYAFHFQRAADGIMPSIITEKIYPIYWLSIERNMFLLFFSVYNMLYVCIQYFVCTRIRDGCFISELGYSHLSYQRIWYVVTYVWFIAAFMMSEWSGNIIIEYFKSFIPHFSKSQSCCFCPCKRHSRCYSLSDRSGSCIYTEKL